MKKETRTVVYDDGLMLEAYHFEGTRQLPGFSENIIYDDEAAFYLRRLHEMVMKGNDDFGKCLLDRRQRRPGQMCSPLTARKSSSLKTGKNI